MWKGQLEVLVKLYARDVLRTNGLLSKSGIGDGGGHKPSTMA